MSTTDHDGGDGGFVPPEYCFNMSAETADDKGRVEFIHMSSSIQQWPSSNFLLDNVSSKKKMSIEH